MINFKDEIADILFKENIEISKEKIKELIEIPKNTEMGDFSFPCFILAKSMRKNPAVIAEEIAKNLNSDLFEKINSLNAYINFFINKKFFINDCLNDVIVQKEKYGSQTLGSGKNIIVEYSSPNIAKPFHIGHIRTTLIGDSIKRIYKFLGFNVTGINYIGDYGTQFGVMIAAYRLWGDDEKIKKNPIKELMNLYVKYNKESENNPEMMDVARDNFNKLENGSEEEIKIWQWMKQISLEEFDRVYKMLGIEFDNYNGEYYNSKRINDVIEELRDKNLLTKSQGAEIVDLSKFNIPSVIIIKSNGSSTYLARDLATAEHRKIDYDFNKNIYVVASQQDLHFIQMKKILNLMGYDWADDCIHVNFGMVSLKDGAMSTRKGRVVFLEDVINKSIEKTENLISEKNPNLENKEEIAKKVGIGAIKFQELYNSRIKDYTFDWDEVLNFDGETGPYVQYTYARSRSILRKGNFKETSIDKFENLNTDIEFELTKSINNFKDSIEKAMLKNEPSIISRNIMEIAKLFNKYYNSVPILVDDEILKKERMSLVYASSIVIKIGLNLLGIDTVEKM
ncbi:MAG: arginine--tRNA ligase [Peptoniphilaceae bacterium]|nr:arginine--tRNA ligase [Peptoniphilaceae bacterium]MDD7383276.1 arginine--tRNA ligase [Peptoniphilaceae bacterium]MDY3738353.1 arginine--tRNA ligase [Peptoniphilaceae bacterium]